MRKNPATYSQPDLFEEGDTPNFVPLEELDEATLRRLPRKAYSFDEWDELDDDIKVAVLIGDPAGETPKAGLKRLDFDEDDWDVLPEDIQEHIYETDEDSQGRVERMKKALEWSTASIGDEEDIWNNWAESELDHFFGDTYRLGTLYGTDLLERLEEEYPNVDWEDNQDMVVALAAEGPLAIAANYELELIRGRQGEVAIGIQPFWMNKSALLEHFPPSTYGSPLAVGRLTHDEIQRAIDEREEEDPDVFAYLDLDPNEIIELRDSSRDWEEINRDYDYDFVSVSVDPNWDEIINDLIAETEIQDLIEEAEEEGGISKLKEEDYTEEDFEDRILDRIQLHDGLYSIIDLVPEELKKESKKMKHCVGQVRMGYGNAIRRGEIRILSVRPSDTKERIWERTFTLEVKLDPPDNTSNIKDLLAGNKLHSIEQMKSTRNRIPGFAKPAYGQRATADDLVYPEEFDSMLKVAEHLGFHYDEVRDLWPGGEIMMKMESERAKKNPPFTVQMPTSSFDKPYGSQ